MFGGKNWKSSLLARPKKRGEVQEGIENQDTIMQVESTSNVKVMNGLMLAKSTTQNGTSSTKHLRIVKCGENLLDAGIQRTQQARAK